MGQLIEVAQNLMDLYYQQYKSDEDFFEEYHFKYIVAAGYAKLLQDKYEKSYRQNKAENNIGEATLNPQWFVSEEIEVVASEDADRELTLKSCPFFFDFDKQSSSIQGIYPLSGKCREFIRIDIDSLWKLNNAPNTNIVYWYVMGNKIKFRNIQCGLKKVRITYIPSLKELEDTCSFPDSMVFDTITFSYNMMRAAREGTVIDFTNNQNPNKVLETELDTVFKNLKTNP